MDHPDGPALLELERHCRQKRSSCSGLGTSELLGRWRLVEVWGKGRSNANPLNGALLRSLGAELLIEASSHDAVQGRLQLHNRVRLGALELCFSGPGRLQGTRPLLLFSFERLKLLLGDRTLWSRPLPPAQPRRQPFFALIGSGLLGEGPGRWLAARGRGGGLALWIDAGSGSLASSTSEQTPCR